VAIEETGQPLLGLEFKHTDFGMWSPDLADILLAAVDSGKVKSKGVKADEGEGAIFEAAPGPLPQLPLQVEVILKKAIERFGSLPLSRLIAVAKSTIPFVYSREGEWIDWKMATEEHCRGEHMLTSETLRELQKSEEEIRMGRGRRLPASDALIELD